MFRTTLLATVLVLLSSTSAIADTIEQGLEAFASNRYEAAYELLIQSKNTSDARRNYYLGLIHSKGLGRKVNKQKARHYFEQAAQQGYLEAIYSLGRLYSTGNLKDAAYVVAAEWFKKAADEGHADSLFSLAKLYSDGKGVQQDRNKAQELFSLAAHAGSVDAQITMATYTNEVDEKLAWFSKAANQGDYRAQKSLGDLFVANDKLADNEAKAIQWYELAAANGSDTANLALGKLYETGSEAIRSDDKALIWYKRAMELELSIASFHVESLIQKKCAETATTKVLDVYILCATRAKMQETVIDNGGVQDYSASSLDEDLFSDVNVFNRDSRLAILYENSILKKLVFSFNAEADSEEFQNLLQILRSQYGETHPSSGSTQNPNNQSWLMRDSVEISLVYDDISAQIIVQFWRRN